MNFISWQKLVRMQIFYPILGNCYFGLIHNKYWSFLQENMPKEFLGKNVNDLGCGDGRSTVTAAKILKPKTIKGFDINEALLKKAQKKGVTIEKIDLNKTVPKGELAFVWGVAHHLENPEKFIKTVAKNYQFAIFREPVKNFWSFLDGGEPLPTKEWEKFFKSLPGKTQIFSPPKIDSVFVFWKKSTK